MCTQSKDGHRGGVTSLTRTSHGRLMSGGRDKQLYLWSSLHWCNAKLPPPPNVAPLKLSPKKKGKKGGKMPGRKSKGGSSKGKGSPKGKKKTTVPQT